MPAYYFDTSALVKRYAAETGSAWVRQMMGRQAGPMIYTSVLAQPEAISALQRKVRDGDLEADRARTLTRRLSTHFAQRYALVAITSAVIEEACALLQRHPLRAYDALQRASAMALRAGLQPYSLPAPLFVAADDTLLAAAAMEGFVVDNPLHPP